MSKKIKVNELNMDYQTYKKVSPTMNPKDRQNTNITSDKPVKPNSQSAYQTPGISSVQSVQSVTENGPIEPQDKATIKYLSNVKDGKTGEVSKPFTIADKKYQMVRGITPSKEVVMAVFCHDDLNEAGENIIHPMDYFEENIAKPMKERMEMINDRGPAEQGLTDVTPKVEEGGYDHASAEREFHDKDALMAYINLEGLEGFKHFFVNTDTGEITAEFRTTKEMIRSRRKLQPNEDYMDAKALKRYRFGEYFDNNKTGDVSEDITTDAQGTQPNQDGVNVSKLQHDVKKLTTMIKNKFSVYLSKLDKPIEQAQFLTAMAAEIGVPLNKLSSIITTFKDIAQQGVKDTQLTNQPPVPTENKVVTKNQLEESVNPKKVIRKVKVKDIQ